MELNCAQYFNNPELLTSQLFGHMKGAFTGAENDHIGIIEAADGGIVFLDEIHRLPPEGQEKLFTHMDKSVFRRVGKVVRGVGQRYAIFLRRPNKKRIFSRYFQTTNSLYLYVAYLSRA
ncbi:sigma 54-interacting transcriptional regulator [Enterococcus avium]